MDWHHELLASVVWLGKVFALNLIGLFFIAIALSRWTSRSVWPRHH